MKVLICGDRNYTNKERIDKFILSLPFDTEIIEGEARGADSIARDCAETRGLKVHKFPADWGKYFKAAGPIRNSQMLKEGKPDLVIAYHDNIKESKGTKNMATISLKAGIPVYLNVEDYLYIELKIVEQYKGE
jgi:hypothetical protein